MEPCANCCSVFTGHLLSFFSCFFSPLFWPHCKACGILVLQPGIEPTPLAVEAQSLNLCTDREDPVLSLFKSLPLVAESSWSLEAVRKIFLGIFRVLNDSRCCLEDYNLVGETDNSCKKQTAANVIVDLINKYKYIGNKRPSK